MELIVCFLSVFAFGIATAVTEKSGLSNTPAIVLFMSIFLGSMYFAASLLGY